MGNPVQLVAAPNQLKQFEKVTSFLVDVLTKKGVKPSQIAVLIGDNINKHSKYEMLRNFTLPNGAVWSIENGFKANQVLVDTVKRFKGLEADIVIVWGLPSIGSNELQEVLYVGASRAKSELIIVSDSESIADLG
jgi:superfamily I DNA and RNA helicase